MKILKKIKFLPIVFLISFLQFLGVVRVVAQIITEREIDSLKLVLPKLKNDTNKLNALNGLAMALPDGEWEKYNAELEKFANELVQHSNVKISNSAKRSLASAINNWGYLQDANGKQDLAIELYLRSLQLRKEVNDQAGVAQSLNNLATLYQTMGNVNKAIDYFEQSLNIRKEINDKEGIAESLNNLGFLYDHLGDYLKALSFHQQSYALREKINDVSGMCGSLINIGNIYSNNLNDHIKAIIYWRKSMELSIKSNNKANLAHALNNIGVAFKKIAELEKRKRGFSSKMKSEIDSAYFYCKKSLKIRNETNDKKGIAYSLNNLGQLSLLNNNFDDAEKYFLESLSIRKQINDKKDIAITLTDIGYVNFYKNNYNIAEKYASEAHKIALEIGFPEVVQRSSHLMYQLSLKKGSFEKALNYYTLFNSMKDSIQNQDIKKEMLKQQYQFEYKTKVSADSIKVEEERKLMKLKFEKERSQRYALYGGLVIVLIFGFFIFNRYRITHKQKLIIERKELETQRQKQLIELKNAEVLSSIEYAKRIQSAILPSNRIIKEYLLNSFVLYLPKDIVAGDFYWIEKIDSKIYLAVCDCTGHGVPGAMVSVVCNNALNRAVAEFGERETGNIFNKTRELILENFTKSDDDVKDGMDASLCAIDLETKQMQWSGANNPLWIYKNKSKIIEEIKGDKQPIGKTENASPFCSHNLALDKDDIVYLFSDGYADQFGGEKLKKLTKAKFRELLLSIAEMPLEEQKNKLLELHNQYKNKEEQLDDICVVGFKV